MDNRKACARETQVRFFRFLTVGGTAAIVQFSSVWLWSKWFGSTVAFTLSFVCSTTAHYLLNRGWALPSIRSDRGRQLCVYLATVALSYLVNLGGFLFFHRHMGFDVRWSTALAIPPSTLFVFLLLNYRVFRIRG